jgi:hypothetical protein
MDYLNGKDQQLNTKDSNNNLNFNKKEVFKENNYPKPVIKKDNIIQHNNNKLKKNNYINNVVNNKEEKEIVNVIIPNNKEKEKELENINLLKKNLMGNILMQNNQNVIATNISNNNFNFNEKKQNPIAINPSNFNLDRDINNIPSSKPKVRSSIEIESNKTPKIEKMPSLESRNSDKRIDRKNESPAKAIDIKKNYNQIINNKKRESPVNNNFFNKEREINKGKKLSKEEETVNSDKESVQILHSERKRSESRGSEEGQKNLKDFMKNMMEKVNN